MSKSKHTPGPWLYDAESREIQILDEEFVPIVVAEIVDGSDMASEEQLLADGNLIAAAPELLAALLSYRKAVFAGVDSDPALWANAALKAKAAIAKAEGRVDG